MYNPAMVKSLVVVFSLLAGSMAWADDHALHEHMGQIGKAMGGLRKAVQAKAMSDVSSGAAVMIEHLPPTVGEWEKRNMSDAVEWTKESVAHAKDLKSAADAGDSEKVSASFSKLGGTCKSCHQAHREEIPDTNPKKYKIK